jgi:cell division protein FtsW
MLAVQVLMNIMVVTSLMPPTGVTLPFVSFGGTAILLFLSSMGIMINISRHESKPGKKPRDHGRTV